MTDNAIQAQREQFQSLVARSEKVNEKRIRLEQDLAAARKSLEEARAKAREAFGTDDLESLRDLYRRYVEENTKRVQAFENAICSAEAILADVEQGLGEPRSEAARSAGRPGSASQRSALRA